MTQIPEPFLAYKKSAWSPQTSIADKPNADSRSKFLGLPWLAPDELWPLCANCQRPLTFFFQLNLDELPAQIQGEFGGGLLQFFYCTAEDPQCEIDCEAWEPFAESTLLRIVHPDACATKIDLIGPDLGPAKIIDGWQQVEDYPSTEEVNLPLSDEDWAALDVLYEQDIQVTQGGDKLAGWPAWVQGVEYPRCPICREKMRLLFQLDSEDHLPYMWGDVGTGHITQCQAHQDQVAFAWACG